MSGPTERDRGRLSRGLTRRASPWAFALTAAALVAFAGPAAIADDGSRWDDRAEEIDKFISKVDKALEEFQKAADKAAEKAAKDAEEAAKDAKKAADDAAKAAEKAAKDPEKAAKDAAKAAEKAMSEKEQAKRAEEREKAAREREEAALKRHEEWLSKMAEKGKINPTNIPVIDSDFFAMAAMPAQQIDAWQAHESATGQGVLVAVLDSGFNLSHPFIEDRICPFAFDALECDFDPEDCGNGFDDDFDGSADTGVGHGTFVAGMVLLAAPDAMILPVRIADDEGYGTEDEIAFGIEFAIAMGADVINLSLEAGTKSGHIKSLLDDAKQEGIVIVTSAGNGGEEDLGMIADRSYTICVGAVDFDDVESEFTNVGTEKEQLTVYAPGVDLRGPYGWPYDEAMCLWSGTSFSAGIVSGAVALRIEVSPESTHDEIQEDIEVSVDPTYDRDGVEIQGAGRINLRKVVER